MENKLLEAKIEKSKEVLRLARDMSLEYYGKPLVLTYSGGKDSDVMLDIAIKTLKPDEFEVINSHTSVDAPETVYHIREVFNRVRGGGYAMHSTLPKGQRWQANYHVEPNSKKTDTTNTISTILLCNTKRSKHA